jgi:hypothetical protein
MGPLPPFIEILTFFVGLVNYLGRWESGLCDDYSQNSFSLSCKKKLR